MHIELSVFVFMIISYLFNPICSVIHGFAVKLASVATAVAFIFTFAHAFTPTYVQQGLTCTSFIFSSVSLTARTLNSVILDIRPFDAACIFYESTESAGGFVLR